MVMVRAVECGARRRRCRFGGNQKIVKPHHMWGGKVVAKQHGSIAMLWRRRGIHVSAMGLMVVFQRSGRRVRWGYKDLFDLCCRSLHDLLFVGAIKTAQVRFHGENDIVQEGMLWGRGGLKGQKRNPMWWRVLDYKSWYVRQMDCSSSRPVRTILRV
ncbi:hypothetical protein P171DRAFT_65837 [Karstenula rhodostoma CBS 690.94]|uniref:Uncharacterized protein n=1 Tax=Karstenula rhodostoma CBS 690.94 TaxID=1392251 RepID=A0A9P4U8I6_9PLEO|nr:hypothetical protein P171DRAFT_65837 [Karstenula rhodostoma CBS 690.94]